MKNTRWSRLAACFLALVMLLAMAQFAAYASDVENPATENKVPESVDSGDFAIPMAVAPYHTTLDVKDYTTVSYIGADGNVTDLAAAMNPNVQNRVQLTITGLDEDPEITKDTTLVWNIPDDITITGIDSLSSDEVTGTVEGNTLQLDWLGEKADQVTVSVPVIPHIAADDDLSGSYILGTAGNENYQVMLGYNTFPDSSNKNRGRINGFSFTEEGGQIITAAQDIPVWTLTHVSGNYYTVYSENAHQYLRIIADSNNGITMESTDQASAQKILLTHVKNGYYSFSYNDKSLNNSSFKAENGFACYNATDKGDNAILKLYPLSAVSDDATVDLSGTWMIANEGDAKNKRLLSSSSSGSNSLVAVAYNINDDGILIPNDNIQEWTIEHVSRDWYNVYSDAGYLNISADGISVSATAQQLLAQSNDGFQTFVLTDGQYTLKRGGTDNLLFQKTKVDYTNETKLNLIHPDKVSYAPVNISGSWGITTACNGAAMIANIVNGKLESVPYEEKEDGKIFYPGREITLWNFTQVDGNWYTITTEDGLYLSIGYGRPMLTTSRDLVFIQKYNNEYRFAGAKWNALSVENGDPTKGYKAKTGGKAVDSKEWHTLRPVFTGGVNVLNFDVNGGSAVEVPAAVMGEAGDKVILPDMQATKDGAEFIGWYQKNTDYYASKANNESSTCRPLLKPGTEYTLPRGTTTLYAVYNKTSRNIRFGIRVDGVIQDEPNNYPSGDYKGHFWVNGIRESNTWIIDTNPMKSVNGYYLENNVTASLSRVPTADEIRNALKKEGNIPFDPETQYIHWYVLKWTGSEWHIDGVIRNKAQVEIAYEANVSDPNEKINIEDFPGSYQVPVGSQVLIGTEKNSSNILTPERDGYVFTGWNTQADGTGKGYAAGSYVRLNENMHLYAQWKDVSEGKLAIRITSDWPQGKPAYTGTPITLTANLTGFENKDYTLQWQYSPDNRATWIDIPGENGMTMTYEISDQNDHYIWRVVARDVRDKE